jgi:hypothetical protein
MVSLTSPWSTMLCMVLFCAITCHQVVEAQTTFRVANIFSDHMVLQRGSASVWGWGKPFGMLSSYICPSSFFPFPLPFLHKWCHQHSVCVYNRHRSSVYPRLSSRAR